MNFYINDVYCLHLDQMIDFASSCPLFSRGYISQYLINWSQEELYIDNEYQEIVLYSLEKSGGGGV